MTFLKLQQTLIMCDSNTSKEKESLTIKTVGLYRTNFGLVSPQTSESNLISGQNVFQDIQVATPISDSLLSSSSNAPVASKKTRKNPVPIKSISKDDTNPGFIIKIGILAQSSCIPVNYEPMPVTYLKRKYQPESKSKKIFKDVKKRRKSNFSNDSSPQQKRLVRTATPTTKQRVLRARNSKLEGIANEQDVLTAPPEIATEGLPSSATETVTPI